MDNYRLLVIEDDVKLAAVLKEGLNENGYITDVVYDGAKAKNILLNSKIPYDLIVLDLLIPSINGIELTKIIRAENIDIPILMLTALGTTEDKLLGFESGADDYLVKPFEFRELLARINVLIRRTKKNEKDLKLKVADLEIDLLKKTVVRKGIKIELTPKEFALLEYLVKNKDRVVSRTEIAENVWGIDFDTGTNIIDVYINYIRKKIDKEFDVKLLHTHFGLGYILKTPKIED